MSSLVSTYTNDILTLRQQRKELLLADRGWLTVAGLFWLHPGENSLGAAPDNTVILAGTGIPAYAGTLTVDHGQIRLHAATGVTLLHNDKPVTELLMQDDMSGQADYVTLNTLTLMIIKRGSRYAVRLFDSASPARQTFTDLHWYPIDPAWRVIAHFEAYDPPRVLAIDNVLGDTNESSNPGAVSFTLAGHPCRLEAEGRGHKLFFNFRDLTNRDATYGAGRFLYTDVAVDGKVTLDFNQATNPYCAYTPYATCPLPPPQNRLPLRVEAGEMRYAG